MYVCESLGGDMSVDEVVGVCGVVIVGVGVIV